MPPVGDVYASGVVSSAVVVDGTTRVKALLLLNRAASPLDAYRMMRRLHEFQPLAKLVVVDLIYPAADGTGVHYLYTWAATDATSATSLGRISPHTLVVRRGRLKRPALLLGGYQVPVARVSAVTSETMSKFAQGELPLPAEGEEPSGVAP